MPKTIPLGAALGVECDLVSDPARSVAIYGLGQLKTYHIIIDDSGTFVNDFLFEANSAEKRRVDEIQGKATAAACVSKDDLTRTFLSLVCTDDQCCHNQWRPT